MENLPLNKEQQEVLDQEVKEILPVVTTVDKNKKLFLYSIVGFLAVILTLGSVWGIVRVRSGAMDGFSYFIAKALHLSLLSVDGQKVSYTNYLDDMKAIKIMKAYEEEANGTAMELSEEQMSDQVVWRLVNNVMVSQIAKKMEIKVEKKDVEELKNQVLEQFESADVLEKELIKRYGWNMKAYEEKVIRPFVLQNKVNEKIQTDKESIEEVRNNAEAVLNQIKNGANFEEMAMTYGEDGTAQTGGELGWFTKGEMVPQFEEAVFALKKGELSENLVETEFGYHIVKVNDIKNERVKDETDKWINQTSVNASHILFMLPTFEKYMNAYLKNVEIKFYSKIHNPFDNNQTVPIVTE